MVIGYSGGKECCSNVSSRLWGGALRDDTKNGCEGDYEKSGLCGKSGCNLWKDPIFKVFPLTNSRIHVCHSIYVQGVCRSESKTILTIIIVRFGPHKCPQVRNSGSLQ